MAAHIFTNKKNVTWCEKIERQRQEWPVESMGTMKSVILVTGKEIFWIKTAGLRVQGTSPLKFAQFDLMVKENEDVDDMTDP